MIKLANLLKEVESIDSYRLSKKVVDVKITVDQFFKKNKDVLVNFAKKDDWNSIYKLAFQLIPQFDQDDIAQELNNIILSVGWLTEEEYEMKSKYNTIVLTHASNVNEVNAAVSKWVKKNRTKLIKLGDNNEYNKFYQLAKDQFPDVQEYKLVQAVNIASIEHGINYEIITEV